MMVKDLGGNSTGFDKTLMKIMKPKEPIKIGEDGRAWQEERDVGEIE